MALYNSIIFSKTNLPVPVFSSGKTFSSKYDPLRESEQFAEKTNNADFFLIFGLGAAYNIFSLAKKFPNSKICAVEKTKSDINFLYKNIDGLEKKLIEKNITVISLNELEETLKTLYLPAIFPNFSVIFCRSWADENKEILHQVNTTIQKTLEEISCDYATQSKFGKIWQHNILKNLTTQITEKKYTFPTQKKALIVGAGSSLNSKIEYIKTHKDEYFIIATDTAYSSLKKNNIFCDSVVSLDGQFISKEHFSFKKKYDESRTVFVFDISANAVAVKKASKISKNIIFSTSGHPFSKYLENLGNTNFLHLNSGSGTVLIYAIDFANKVGFSKIELFGADFGYIDNTPYSQGTYFDTLFLQTQNKIASNEKKYIALNFSKPLIKKANKIKTTELLESYRISFLRWIKQNNFNLEQKENSYFLEKKSQTPLTIQTKKINVLQIKKFLKNVAFPDKNLTIALLPYVAFLRNTKQYKTKQYNFLLNLALDDLIKYTIIL